MSSTNDSSFLSYDTWSTDDSITKVTTTNEKICSFPNLSDKDSIIWQVESLPPRIVPNEENCPSVARAMSKMKEQASNNIFNIENDIKNINNTIESQILNASNALKKSLDELDHEMSNMFDRCAMEEYQKVDTLVGLYSNADELVLIRKQYINDFMEVLHSIEARRTQLLKQCYEQSIEPIKNLPFGAYDYIYEHFLKNYNAIKLGNFRAYENVRIYLIQQSNVSYIDFLKRIDTVKSTIIESIGNNVNESFRHFIQPIINDKLTYFIEDSIKVLNSINILLDKLSEKSEKHIGFAYVIKCAEKFKLFILAIDKIIESMTSYFYKISDEIQKMYLKHISDLYMKLDIIVDSSSLQKLSTISTNIADEAFVISKRKSVNILTLQNLLRKLKYVVKEIDILLTRSAQIIHNHSKRVTKARQIILLVLKTTFSENDLLLKNYEQKCSMVFDMLIEASEESDVYKLEQKCNSFLNVIYNIIHANYKNEIKVITEYRDLMITELELVKSEVELVLKLCPKKKFNEFKLIYEKIELSSYMENIIVSFNEASYKFIKSLNEYLLKIIDDLKSTKSLDVECNWIKIIEVGVNHRYEVSKKLHELRMNKIRDGVVTKRIDEIKQHKYLLERHTTIANEIRESLHEEVKIIFKRHDEELRYINDNVKLIMRGMISLSINELNEILTDFNTHINMVAYEFHKTCKDLLSTVDTEYAMIIDSTVGFIKSIKMFPEGGNYGIDEAKSNLETLKFLNEQITEEWNELANMLREIETKTIVNTKIPFKKLLIPLTIELKRKMFEKRYETLNKIFDESIEQEIGNLNKIVDNMKDKVKFVEETLIKNNSAESSKVWSILLTEIKKVITFLIDSHNDIKALVMLQIKTSVWNVTHIGPYISSIIMVNPKHTFAAGNVNFYDFCKTIVIPEKWENPRFLNKIYQLIFHYVFEIQNTTAEFSWENVEIHKDAMDAYQKIMVDAIKKSKVAMLRSEVVWIVKSTELINFIVNLSDLEVKFKNIVLKTYHNDAEKTLNDTYEKFKTDSLKTVCCLKNIRGTVNCRLKMSHGSPNNSSALQVLLVDMNQANKKCADILNKSYTEIELQLKTIVSEYTNKFPLGVLKAATLSFDSNTLQNKIKQITYRTSSFNQISEFDIKQHDGTSFSYTVSTAKQNLVKAIESFKQNSMTKSGIIVVRRENSEYWNNNVQTKRELKKKLKEEYTGGVNHCNENNVIILVKYSSNEVS